MMLRILPESNLSHYLAYMGTIPFIFSALLIVMGYDDLPIIGSAHQLITSYGLVIIAFMAGVHWGQHIERKDKWQSYLPLLSTTMAIISWLSYLLFSFKGFIAYLLILFMLLIVIDKQLRANHMISRLYFKTRCYVTLIVCFCLIMTLCA